MEQKRLPPPEIKIDNTMLTGFRRANEALDKTTERKAPEIRKRRSESQLVYNLDEALMVFRGYVTGTKKLDLHLEGRTVAYLFEAQETGEKFVIMFKRNFYFQFSNHFPTIKETGYGMTCSIKIIHFAATEGYKLVAVMPNGKGYVADPDKVLTYFLDNNTVVPHLPDEMGSPLSMWERKF